MTKKISLIILLLVVGSIIILTLLMILASTPNKKRNGFSRVWLPNETLNLMASSSISENVRICGGTNYELYFSDIDHRKFIVSDFNLKRKDTIHLPVPSLFKLVVASELNIDSPRIFLYSGNFHIVSNFQFDSKNIDTVNVQTPLFTRAIPISSKNIILRGFDSLKMQQLFMKTDLKTGKTLKQLNIFENQKDAGFSTDGFLEYDKSTKTIVYLQLFQNRFYCIDTNLNLIQMYKTIDTSNTNPVNTKLFIQDKQLGSIQPSEPLYPINKECCISDGKLFILSGLIADNEDENIFEKNNVIDIYDIRSGIYKGSFYVPNFNGQKIRNLFIIKNKLVCVFKNKCAIYFLNS